MCLNSEVSLSGVLTMGKGRDLENRLLRDLHHVFVETGLSSDYRVIPSGYSGSFVAPSGDIDIVGPTYSHVLEIKNCDNDVATLKSNDDDDDIDQLRDCVRTSHTRAWAAIKFKRRELVVFELTNIENPSESLAMNCPVALNPRVTRTENVKVDNPSTDVWPSSRSGRSDTDVVLDALGINSDVSVENDSEFDISETTA